MTSTSHLRIEFQEMNKRNIYRILKVSTSFLISVGFGICDQFDNSRYNKYIVSYLVL